MMALRELIFDARGDHWTSAGNVELGAQRMSTGARAQDQGRDDDEMDVDLREFSPEYEYAHACALALSLAQ